jgi:tetratricopeptide (TPR) repeat protein
MHVLCARCKQQVGISHEGGVITASGTILLNIPGIVCSGPCADEFLDLVPDPPGLMGVLKLSPTDAVSSMAVLQFVAGTVAAADFFLGLFPANTDLNETVAIRLHQEGKKKEAYAVLEQGLLHSNDPSRLRLELAAFLGMDKSPESGLQVIRDVSPDTPRYDVIKGNLLRAAGHWEDAAVCYAKAIQSDPSHETAWFNYGYYLLHVKSDFLDAERHYQGACDLFPKEKKFRAYLGDAKFFQNKKAEALVEYRRALSMLGGDDESELSLRRMIDQCNE